MSKVVAESLDKLTISYLNQQGFLKPWSYFDIRWQSHSSKESRFVQFSIQEEISGMRAFYKHIDEKAGEQSELDYRINFLTTHCYYGGKRYWFECPVGRSWSCRGRRIGVLYRCGKHFMCRHCCELTYRSRNLSGAQKGRGRIISIPELRALREKVKRPFYGGKPTKNLLRYLLMNERAKMSLNKFAERIKSRNGV